MKFKLTNEQAHIIGLIIGVMAFKVIDKKWFEPKRIKAEMDSKRQLDELMKSIFRDEDDYIQARLKSIADDSAKRMEEFYSTHKWDVNK